MTDQDTRRQTRMLTQEDVIQGVDLFCGLGGFSQGCQKGAERIGKRLSLVAINHWMLALESYRANHPQDRPLCENLDNVDPRKIVPEGYLRLMIAGPSCTHHSRAAGGKPKSDQLRSSPWTVTRWCSELYVEDVIVENVGELLSWGPLDEEGYPIEELKGQTFEAWINAFRALGYQVEWRILRCCDYGDPTSRERLFVIARRKKPVVWPEPTHAHPDSEEVRAGLKKPWRTARECIRWDVKGKSIYNRKKPLCPATMRKIFAGLQRFSGLPFVIGQQAGSAPRSVEAPLPTVATDGAIALVEPELRPFILNLRGWGDEYARGAVVDDPTPTVTSVNTLALVEPELRPFIVKMDQGGSIWSADEPLPTVTTADAMALAEPKLRPFVISYYGNEEQAPGKVYSCDEPLVTVPGQSRIALVQPELQPFIFPCNHGEDDERAYSLDQPMVTITGFDSLMLANPFLVEYYGTGGAAPVDAPLPTATTKDRFALVEPMLVRVGEKLYLLDIHYRMLMPEELMLAQGFPPGTKVMGNREQKVKQVGNAVPPGTAAALCEVVLSA